MFFFCVDLDYILTYYIEYIIIWPGNKPLDVKDDRAGENHLNQLEK